MKKCINCHQPAEKLDVKGFCEDCFDALHPDDVFDVAYDHSKGVDNKIRQIKPWVTK